MRITEERYKHWKALRERPGVVVMMAARIAECVDELDELFRKYPHTHFTVGVAALAYANQLDGRYHEVNG